MSDIVERLQETWSRAMSLPAGSYKNFDGPQAADEIVRLWAEVGELQQRCAEWREAYEDVEAERDRLRDALTLYREAVVIDVKMEGPRFMGANSSALKRAWDHDRAALGDKP